jgi:protein O-mannosyl-transferase
MVSLRVASLSAGLLALTAAAYLPLWGNDFINYDDPVYITDNPGVKAGLSGPGCWWAWTNNEAPYWLPLTWLSLQFDAHFFSARGPGGEVVLSPAAFHGENLAWHAAGALLLFAVFYRLTGARWRSFLVAALFAVHPMHVESVAWATERKDVLSGFFGALTLWAYVRYCERPGRLRYLGVAAAFALGLLAKPMLMTLPFVLLLLDYWPLARWAPGRGRAALGRLALEKVPLFALAGASAAITLHARESHGALVLLGEVPLSSRLGNALTAYGWYLSATFWPTRLAALYPHPYRNWSAAQALAGVACLLSLTALALWQARRRPWLVVGWLWFVGALVPVIGLAQGGAQAWADRFSYWPHVGLFVAVAWGIGDLAERVRLPRPAWAAAGALALGALAALTWVQVGHWHNSTTLWEHALAVTEDNDRAHQYLAQSYRQEGRLEEAALHIAEAARIQHDRLRASLRQGGGPASRTSKTWAPQAGTSR